MRFPASVALIACLVPAAAGASDHAPAFVIPGRPGVPVMMDGRDVSGAVIEGDWGLYRPGSVAPTIIQEYYGPVGYYPVPGWRAPIGGFFPVTGRAPGYGRREVDDARPVRAAPSYYRSWSAESQPSPVTISPSYEMPSMILSPQTNTSPPTNTPRSRGGRRWR